MSNLGQQPWPQESRTDEFCQEESNKEHKRELKRGIRERAQEIELKRERDRDQERELKIERAHERQIRGAMPYGLVFVLFSHFRLISQARKVEVTHFKSPKTST